MESRYLEALRAEIAECYSQHLHKSKRHVDLG